MALPGFSRSRAETVDDGGLASWGHVSTFEDEAQFRGKPDRGGVVRVDIGDDGIDPRC